MSSIYADPRLFVEAHRKREKARMIKEEKTRQVIQGAVPLVKMKVKP